MTLLAVSFAFSGTELIGIAAGEAQDPQTSVPKAIRTTVVRLALFFVGTIFVLATLLPREQAGVIEKSVRDGVRADWHPVFSRHYELCDPHGFDFRR